MSYKSVFTFRAYKEFLEAWHWYEDKKVGLGDRFQKEVYNLIYKIEQHPERYLERKRHYREAIVNIFPYLIIYRITKKERLIVVMSIFHSSRNPKNKY